VYDLDTTINVYQLEDVIDGGLTLADKFAERVAITDSRIVVGAKNVVVNGLEGVGQVLVFDEDTSTKTPTAFPSFVPSSSPVTGMPTLPLCGDKGKACSKSIPCCSSKTACVDKKCVKCKKKSKKCKVGTDCCSSKCKVKKGKAACK
jgi:hypothetical protein